MLDSRQTDDHSWSGPIASRLRITVFHKGQTLMGLYFDKPAIKIGRMTDNDIVLPFQFISRHHCEIQFDGRGWRAADLGSKNGLADDRNRSSSIIRLEHRSELRIQDVTLLFEMETEEEREKESTKSRSIRVLSEAETQVENVKKSSSKTSKPSTHKSKPASHSKPQVRHDELEPLRQVGRSLRPTPSRRHPSVRTSNARLFDRIMDCVFGPKR